MRTERLARGASISAVLVAVIACSNAPTPSSTVPPTPGPTSSAPPIASPSVPPTASPSPTPSPIPSPPQMAPAVVKRGPAMTQARFGQAAVRLGDGRTLLFGGTVPFVGKCPMVCTDPPTAAVDVYDPSSGKLRRAGSLVEPVHGAQALLLEDGRVVVIGSTNFGIAEMLQLYDPATGRSTLVKLPENVPALPSDPTAVLLADGRVLIAGGTYDYDASTERSTLIFDPISGGLSYGPIMAKPRQEMALTLLPDGRVLVVGGEYFESYNGYEQDSAEVIDMAHPTSTLVLLDPYKKPGLGFGSVSTLLADGRVLVTGGGWYDDEAGCNVPEVPEIFDPAAGRFTQAGPMAVRRTGSAAVRISDGRVLVFGGVDSTCQATDAVEAFDPGTGTFQVVATGFPKVSDFTATLLNDGQVLIAGGWNGQWNGMTSATWLIRP